MTERERELHRARCRRWRQKPENREKERYYTKHFRPKQKYVPGILVWRGMIARCYNPKSTSYHLYGARGVLVCDRWRSSFENFWADMGPTYVKGLSLERKDNSLGYSPSNCKWADDFEQANNKRNNRWLTTPWGELTLAQTARKLQVYPSTLFRQLKRGLSIPQIVQQTETFSR